MLKLKICGLTQAPQAVAIAQLGVDAIGFICVPSSPRYIAPGQIGNIITQLTEFPQLLTVGVFANAELETINDTVNTSGINTIQLHGQESPEFVTAIRAKFANHTLIKALRIKDQASLDQAQAYAPLVDILLLDAYHPEQLGGTGQAWDWNLLSHFQPECPWWLAGGLTPNNASSAIAQTQPDGIDLSSGVEHSPGNKDLAKVQALMRALENPFALIPF
ncbi:phosphoribosylanthranilate isomerase [Thermosynechococcaceae cyanobacterium BACA0444]|uniref:N-(5'-phosphoribosyl)anthranilate isomerase n=1 Tax=Pseudocalidococcus azoricus BACA0444 TaxID=2918990 RepID=A0AAE4JXV0_9CYAN|nr:phosphoribosylanthranilate isomerase [Pseudocalidococcus azoricus]MDS3861403.1 phosphoribosylanthranilate isomerase [Pseudocalidococcus azoricus BACA0444]